MRMPVRVTAAKLASPIGAMARRIFFRKVSPFPATVPFPGASRHCQPALRFYGVARWQGQAAPSLSRAPKFSQPHGHLGLGAATIAGQVVASLFRRQKIGVPGVPVNFRLPEPARPDGPADFRLPKIAGHDGLMKVRLRQMSLPVVPGSRRRQKTPLHDGQGIYLRQKFAWNDTQGVYLQHIN